MTPLDHTPPESITDHRLSGVLELRWPDGASGHLTHERLRSHCRCGGCEQLRRNGQPIAPPDPSLRLVGIEPVGDKGLNLVFTDGHDRGIYPWAYLRELSAAPAD